MKRCCNAPTSRGSDVRKPQSLSPPYEAFAEPTQPWSPAIASFSLPAPERDDPTRISTPAFAERLQRVALLRHVRPAQLVLGDNQANGAARFRAVAQCAIGRRVAEVFRGGVDGAAWRRADHVRLESQRVVLAGREVPVGADAAGLDRVADERNVVRVVTRDDRVVPARRPVAIVEEGAPVDDGGLEMDAAVGDDPRVDAVRAEFARGVGRRASDRAALVTIGVAVDADVDLGAVAGCLLERPDNPAVWPQQVCGQLDGVTVLDRSPHRARVRDLDHFASSRRRFATPGMNGKGSLGRLRAAWQRTNRSTSATCSRRSPIGTTPPTG